MLRWLEERDEPLPDDDGDHAHGGGHDELMPGMLTDDQLDQLAAARGEEFDRLFLELMHYHHRGALVMVQDLLEGDNGREPELWSFVNHIDSDQQIELGRIESMLAEIDAGSG